jgi:hypothetical protein
MVDGPNGSSTNSLNRQGVGRRTMDNGTLLVAVSLNFKRRRWRWSERNLMIDNEVFKAFAVGVFKSNICLHFLLILIFISPSKPTTTFPAYPFFNLGNPSALLPAGI